MSGSFWQHDETGRIVQCLSMNSPGPRWFFLGTDKVASIIEALTMTRPPNDRGQGRKPLKEGEATTSMTIRVTVGQREKLARLGGAQWLRDKIDRAKSA